MLATFLVKKKTKPKSISSMYRRFNKIFLHSILHTKISKMSVFYIHSMSQF